MINWEYSSLNWIFFIVHHEGSIENLWTKRLALFSSEHSQNRIRTLLSWTNSQNNSPDISKASQICLLFAIKVSYWVIFWLRLPYCELIFKGKKVKFHFHIFLVQFSWDYFLKMCSILAESLSLLQPHLDSSTSLNF